MIHRQSLFLIIALLGYACSSSENASEDQAAIYSIMDQQVACWNKGDLDCFMEGYWQSDSLMFIGGNGVVYGYDNTLERYQRTYPDRATMGQLTFDIVTLDRLASDAYFMVGQWTLDRQDDEIGGHFTLLFRKLNGRWVIVKDHSSST